MPPGNRGTIRLHGAGGNRRQSRPNRQGGREVVSGQAKLANVRWQGPFLAGQMLDGVRPGHPLGGKESKDEEDPAQGSHGC